MVSRRLSNGKQKGEKCGNRYLSWAFVEAANFASDDNCRRWFDRKSTVLVTKALACNLAKAAWHTMAKKITYDGREPVSPLNKSGNSLQSSRAFKCNP